MKDFEARNRQKAMCVCFCAILVEFIWHLLYSNVNLSEITTVNRQTRPNYNFLFALLRQSRIKFVKYDVLLI